MSNRACILVADDERNLCRVLVARLTKAGYRAEAVHDGGQALAQLDRAGYDLVLLDLRMPVRGGLDVLPEIRLRHPRTSVLVMTAYDSPESVSAAMAAGADAYVTKPFDLDNVMADIRALLAGQRRVPARAGGRPPAPPVVMLA